MPAEVLFPGDRGDDSFSEAIASAGDINGDGFSDLVIGDPCSASTGPCGDGRVFFYPGGERGVDATGGVLLPDPLAGPGMSMRFGSTVAGLGDINGDGYADLMVGSPTVNGAYVYLGSATGPTLPAIPLTTPTAVYPEFFGHTAVGLGDLDGDGRGEFAVGGYGVIYVYAGADRGGLGRILGYLPAPERSAYMPFDDDLAADDVNGDGFADVLTAAADAPYISPIMGGNGRAYLFLGGAAGFSMVPSFTLAAPDMVESFGLNVATPGDLDGDGFGDMAIDTMFTPTMMRSRIDVLMGASSTPGLVRHLLSEPVPGDFFQIRLALRPAPMRRGGQHPPARECQTAAAGPGRPRSRPRPRLPSSGPCLPDADRRSPS